MGACQSQKATTTITASTKNGEGTDRSFSCRTGPITLVTASSGSNSDGAALGEDSFSTTTTPTNENFVTTTGHSSNNNGAGSTSRGGYVSDTTSGRDVMMMTMEYEQQDGVFSGGAVGGYSSGGLSAKALAHSESALFLADMIEDRKKERELQMNVVHIEDPFGRPIEEVYDGVHTGPVLGSGISGMVRLVTHRATGVRYAVKCLDLSLIKTEQGRNQLREEIYIMCQLDHPNIVRLEEVYEGHSKMYLVQELCLGGDLFDRLDEQPDEHFTEGQCARLVKQMLCSVRYLHSKGIIHRDLKLENFLFSMNDPDSELRMIDFGLSKHFTSGEVQHEAVGSPYTVSPEIILGSYDERCDIWAIGVIAYLLLSGDAPFGGCYGADEVIDTVRCRILAGVVEFEPEDIWENVSDLAKDFIRTLLVKDPNNRPTAEEAQKHRWLVEWSDREKRNQDTKLSPNVVEALMTFREFTDLRKLLCEVISFTLLPDQVKELRKEFEKMDTDGTGEISLSSLKRMLLQNTCGELSDEDVEDIFDAMRVRKNESRLHWHEFLAAGLSQCKVDDRNIRLAFDRLDNDHKGYITFDDVMDLVGVDDAQNEDAMRRMWRESMKTKGSYRRTRITYDDFRLDLFSYCGATRKNRVM